MKIVELMMKMQSENMIFIPIFSVAILTLYFKCISFIVADHFNIFNVFFTVKQRIFNCICQLLGFIIISSNLFFFKLVGILKILWYTFNLTKFQLILYKKKHMFPNLYTKSFWLNLIFNWSEWYIYHIKTGENFNSHILKFFYQEKLIMTSLVILASNARWGLTFHSP